MAAHGPAPEAGAPEFEIDSAALLESFGPLATQGLSFSDYASAVEELISELLRRGLLSPGVIGTGNRGNETNGLYTQSIDAVFARVSDRWDKAVS